MVSVRPGDAATKVYLNSIVAILFSEPIDAATLTASSLTLTGPGGAAVAGAVSISESGLLAFFVPNAALSAGSLYTIRVDGITDLAGNALGSLTSTFTTYPAPTITGFAPAQGPAGTAVTISGEHFDADLPENNTVTFFDGNEAAVSEATATALKVTVPSGAINGPITVSTPGGTATSAQEFIVALPPTIAGFSPTSGFVGASVTITGADFDAIPSNNIVRFNGVATTLESATTTVLTVKVPAGAASGPLSVTTPGGTATTADHFTVNPKPEISGVTPGSGTVGTAVTVTGLNFNSITPSDNQISFNGTGSIITSVTATTITTIVPLGATTGPVTVTNSGGTASTASFTVLPKQDFSITASPAQTSVVQGKTTTYQIQVNSAAGDFLTHFVQLSAANLPTGVTAAFSPSQISGGQLSTLTVTTTASASAGNIGITVSGTAFLEGKTVVRQATLQLLVVASGGTTLSGRVLASKDDRPIAGAKLKLGGQVATTDESGNFLFSNPPIGDQVILLDGPTSAYPADLPVPVTIATGVANDLLYPIYLHEVSQEYVTIVPGQEAIVNPPNIPDFSMHIPQGTTIVGWDGQPNTQVSVTPVPIDRLPIRPIPEGIETRIVYMFNFGKPGGGYPTRPIPIVYPNDLGAEPGERINLWYYDESAEADPGSNQWRIYGQGTVSQDGRTIIPDPGVGQPKFCCGGGFTARESQRDPDSGDADDESDDNNNDSDNNEDPDDDGLDPVDLSSGLFIINKTDIVLPGIIPIKITRTYRNESRGIGIFGVGGNFNYDLFIQSSGTQALTYRRPNGSSFIFSQQPDGTYINTSYPPYRGVMLARFPDGQMELRRKNGKVLRFNSAGWLVEERDRNHTRILINRNSQNRITEITDSSGRSLTIGYRNITRGLSVFPVIASITDMTGRVVRYGYDDVGRLITVTDPAGGVTTYTYDVNDRMLSITDARGITYLTNEYDATGRVIRQELADGGVYTVRYIVAGRTITQAEVTDANGNTTTYRFNSRQLVSRIIDAQGQMTRFERDFATNQIMAIYDPLNRKTSFTYDLNGNRTSIVDPAGNVTLMEYESNFNRLVKLTNALNQTTYFSHSPQGNLISIIDPLENETTFTYNEAGQPISLTNAMGEITHFTYDVQGNLVATTDPLGNRTEKAYDVLSRLIALTDPTGKTTRYSYDVLNRVTAIEDATSVITQFSYDSNGNLLTITDPKGQTTVHTYDVMDRLETRTDPQNRTEHYEYDLSGNLKTFTDRKGQVSIFSYDSLDRRVLSSFADGSSMSFHYGINGRLTRLSDSASGEVEFDYDLLLDRLVRETTPLGTIKYGYDSLGRRTEMIVNAGVSVTYRYDASSRLTQVAQGDQIVDLDYDAVGRRTSLTYPNRTKSSYTYDAANHLLRILHQGPTSIIQDLAYDYDAAGNRTGFARVGQAATLLPEAVDASYNAANEQIRFNSDTPNLAYDVNGNLISQTDANGTTTYEWDVRNRLIKVSGPGVSAEFIYDALGRRISKTVNGTRVEYQYDRADIVAEVEGGLVGATYLRMLKADEPFVRQGVENEYYHSDALGSVLALTDRTGAAATLYTYDAFGKTTINGNSTNPFQYTGRESDGTGMYYYRARYYSPNLRRFITEDPRLDLNPMSCSSRGFRSNSIKILVSNDTRDLNLYLYAKNNPMLFSDAGGLAPRRRSDCPDCLNLPKCTLTNIIISIDTTDCLVRAPYNPERGIPPPPPPPPEPPESPPCGGVFRNLNCFYSCEDKKGGHYNWSYTVNCSNYGI